MTKKPQCLTCHMTFNKQLNSDLRVSSVQCGLSSPADSRFSPASCRSLLLRSRSFRLEDWRLRTEDKALQLLADILQPLNLKKDLQLVDSLFKHLYKKRLLNKY